MAFEISFLNGEIFNTKAMQEVLACNEKSAQYGLALTEGQAMLLVKTRNEALRANGRIEFGGGTIDKIINAFCDSPYISVAEYERILNELLDIFYYYKSDTMDLIDDDELIEYMKTSFNTVCQGSLEMLAGSELVNLAHNLRFGLTANYTENAENGGDEDELS